MIGVGFEEEAAIVAGLGDRVWGVESDDASEAGHKRECEESTEFLKKTSCPRLSTKSGPAEASVAQERVFISVLAMDRTEE